jgi:molecular chaperone DnaK
METQNIQIGIDLGTTNSEIAINVNGSIEIIKNMSGDEYTPSVFGFDKSNNPVVGKKAYEKLFKDASEDSIKNYKAEVKRIIGTPEKIFFPRVNQHYSAEDISAEILKSLKQDVLRKYPQFFVSAAVITTPASFDTTQAEATKRAGNLAGFEHVVLLQEPIAAAIAYGYTNSKDENMLVFDLGGGTFDVALLRSKDGILTVLSHNGDNFLGGKDFDKIIVNEVIVPKINEKYHIQNFNENNPKYRTTFAKLKYFAENAKMYLSQFTETTIEIDGIGNDENGKEISLLIPFNRDQFEQMIKSIVDRTIDLTQKTIRDAGIAPSSVSKILLVGGPTQIPYVRKRLVEELKIPVDTSLDPLTVVARGASIFAIGQQIPEPIRKRYAAINPNAKNITLHFCSLTAENEESVSGSIDQLHNSTEDYYLQIQSESGHYTSSKIKLKNGKFFDTVALLPKRTNLFWIYLFDKNGKPVPVSPESFSITHGLSVSGAPIPHSIGVAIAKKEFKNGISFTEFFDPIFEKGSILPLKSTARTYHTIKPLKKGEDNFLPVKIYEGESEIPDRNTFICDVKIKGSELPYDLPENTEVELTLRVDESRVVELDVFISPIDRSLSARGSILAEDISLKDVERELDNEIERAKKIEEDCSTEERIKLRRSIDSIDKSLSNANTDEDEKRKAFKQLKELKTYVDELAKEKEFPQLIKEFHGHTAEIERMIEAICQGENKKRDLEQLNALKKEGEKAIAENDKFLLIRVNDQLFQLGSRIYLYQPGAWVDEFKKIANGEKKFLNKREAQYYIEKGWQCINNGDLQGLKECVWSLIKLLPPDEQRSVKQLMSGITK